MNGKLFIAFLVGLVVASGVTYYLTSKPEPAKPAAVAQTSNPPAQAPADQTITPTPAPAQASPPPPVAAETKPSPVVSRPEPAHRNASRWHKASHETRPPQVIHSTTTTTHSSAPVQTASSQPAPAASQEQNGSTAPGSTRLPVYTPPAPPPPPEPPKPNSVTIPAGTLLNVRLGQTLTSEKNHSGDTFSATLDQPLVVDGFVIAERGARAQGRVVEVDRSGKVSGLARLNLELVQLTTSDGQHIKVNTGAFERKADTTHKKDAAKVGIGAAIGAAIGAMAGGGKGAAIGAGVGGGAGAGDVLLTRGKEAEIPVETRLSFRLRDPVKVTERLD